MRAVNAAGAGGAAPDAPPWFASATPMGYDPNLAVDNVFVDPGNGYLDISWSAAAGATHYDIRARESGVNGWHAVAWKVSGTSYRYTTGKTIDYVAVRALSADSIGPWVELSRMPADDFMNVATGISVPAAGGASIQSGASIQAQLAAPTGLTIARTVNRQTAAINLNWTNSTSAGVTAYNVICSPGDNGWGWHACGWENSGTVTYTSVPSAQARPVKVTHYERKAGETSFIPGKYELATSRAYLVNIRAVNANPDDASPWVNSGVIRPVFPYLQDFTYARVDGQISMMWDPNFWTTGYEFYCDAYDPTQTPYVPSYTRCATLTDQDDTASRHSVTITTWTADGTDYSIDNTSVYDIRICSTNATGRGCWLAPWIHPNPSLTASNVAATTATLTIANHSGNWYYKHTNTGATCDGPVSGTTKNLTGLTANTSYTYSAYSDSGCTNANLLATASQFTTPVSVSNLSGAEYGTTQIGNQNGVPHQGAQAFTTGSNTAGYTLSSIDIRFSAATGSPANLVVTLHAASGSDPDTSSTLATLDGSNPTTANSYTYACSGSGCDLSAGTTYFVVMNAPGSLNNAHYNASLTTAAETTQPSNNGWSIADAGRLALGPNWSGIANSAAFRITVTAAPNPSLTASNVAATTATLTIANHSGNWWYQANTGPDATCSSTAVSTTTKALTGLTAGTVYVYTAYGKSGCNAADLLATTTFGTTGTVSAGNLSEAVQVTFSLTSDYAQEFTTGSATGGYTLNGVTLDFAVVTNASQIEASIRGVQSNDTPETSARATLTGTPAAGQVTFTCDATNTNNDCSLAANTSYFVYVDALSPVNNHQNATASDAETLQPSNNGWSIANAARYQAGSWVSILRATP